MSPFLGAPSNNRDRCGATGAFSGDAFPMRALAGESTMNWTVRRILLCSAASLLYPNQVERVSRLIGKFDHTAKHGAWQVELPEPAPHDDPKVFEWLAACAVALYEGNAELRPSLQNRVTTGTLSLHFQNPRVLNSPQPNDPRPEE